MKSRSVSSFSLIPCRPPFRFQFSVFNLLVVHYNPFLEKRILHFISVGVYHITLFLQPFEGTIYGTCPILTRLQGFTR